MHDHHAGGLALMPPTLVTLEEVAAAPSAAALLDLQRDLTPVQPEPVDVDGEVVLRSALPDQPVPPGPVPHRTAP